MAIGDQAARKLLRDMFDAAVASAQPALSIPKFLPEDRDAPLIVIGAGKASAAMARAVEDHWRGPLSGFIVTRYGYGVPCQHIEIVEAAHPVPDAAGLQAAKRLMGFAETFKESDQVLCLISGGGSSLLPLPAPGLTLEHKQAVNRALLASGATITEMNCIRRHLSAIKGGRLAAACHPAQLLTLLISDVPGDDPIDIASGPTVADPTSCADAIAIIERYQIELPEQVRAMLTSGNGESIKPGDERLEHHRTEIIAAPQLALESAAEVARNAGYTPYILGDSLEGEASEVGKVLGGIARQTALREQPFKTPAVLLSGGETTVTVKGSGRGGRNVECLLSMALALNGLPDVYALAADTDGVDGQEEVAGAIITPDTIKRAWVMDMPPAKSLANNDGHGFFESLGDAVISGPTMTNVNDFRAIIVDTPH